MTSWKIPAEPVAATADLSQVEDTLLAQLAEVQFEAAPAPSSAPTVAPPQAVPPLPVHAVDPEYQAIHAALQAGTIPTFAEQVGTIPPVVPQPIDVAAERDAYAALQEFINAHKSPGTTVTFIDPDAFLQSLA